MKLRRLNKWMVLMTMTLMLTTGCSNNGAAATSQDQSVASETTENEQNEKEEQKDESAKEDNVLEDIYGFEDKANEVIVTEDSVIVTDAMGREKELSKNPERVVSLNTSQTALWYEAGGTLVGRVQTSTSDDQLPAECVEDESVAIVATSSSGKNINVESVVDLSSPDLVILGTSMSQPDLAGSFEALGIETVVVDYDDLSDYLKWFKVFANLNDKPELYEEIAYPALETTLEVLNEVPEEGGPDVFSMYAQSTSLSANLSGSNVGGMLDLLGANNIADVWDNPNSADRLDINIESVLKADPDMILIQSMTATEEAMELVESTYGNNPGWNALTAVKEDRVYYLDMSLYHYKAHSRYGEAYLNLAKMLYPDIF